MKTSVLVVAIMAGLVGSLTHSAADDHVVAAADAVKWGPAPPSLPAGAEAAVLTGDPASDGPYVLRLKAPAGYTIPAHSHSRAEHITVLSGIFYIGMGDKLDRTKGEALSPGGFVALPGGMNHYAWVSQDAVLQINAMGPFDIKYVDPADDPRSGKQ